MLRESQGKSVVQTFHQQGFTLRIRDDDAAVTVLLSGRSTAREPGKFMSDVLSHATDLATNERKPLILDFREVDYMNSSSITPLIHVLALAQKSTSKITLIYRKDLRWQDLSFSALQVFETADSPIEIRGV
ncbi:MAG: hypothetical protein HYZ27_04795 [Deltaproteobacteria bacterium]|nr:hypothetical protein [Deltaproteobacteria bacterium]